ncbi:MAG: fumarylacetoacetate hydrolase [Proteobacteria bacterium]|nr:fumarylacetoacetate hydrolase [Pseudomonadota bacterium]RZO98441.1 MAG: FAA hydrolase family protein [Gammaproteobacteria bacterium]|tara:strand:- start:1077 stop:1976 length:900 start_codon:yes stop_codon:yes gene_type:complete
MSFKLGTVGGKAVLIKDDHYFDVASLSNGAISSDSVEALKFQSELSELYDTLSGENATGNLSEIELGNPVPKSPNCYAVGLNYRKHAEESGMDIPEVPMIFTKHTSCFVGPKANVEMRSDYVDWEVELVVVIGKEGKNISKENALEHVAGLCVGQDISDRPTQFATTPAMFNLGKSFDTYGPMGPALVSLDLLENCENLDIECKLNGETVQKSNTSDLIFNVSSIISYLSEIVSLNIGDTIWTGTPSGVGIASGKFLKDGDVLTSSIEGLGSMENKCVRVSDHSRANIVPEFMKGFLKD